MKFSHGDRVRVKDDPKMDRLYRGQKGIVISRESFLVRTIFRTDYYVMFDSDIPSGTFKESQLEADGFR